MVCKHKAQGGTAPSVTIIIEVNFLAPSEIAFKKAVRSAQIVPPKLTFSTLQPVKTPKSLERAAPTRNREYGACAFRRALQAAECSFLGAVNFN